MNTKDFLRLSVPLGEATRRATVFVAQYVLSGSDKPNSEERALGASTSVEQEPSNVLE
jgi:hypothetical protein